MTTTEAKHAPEPWKVATPVGNPPFISNEGTVVIQKVGPLRHIDEAAANARRIVACVNTLAGFTDLELANPTTVAKIQALRSCGQ